MIKLQNNFTTVEQSNRLLELGLPADSADCYHNRIAEKPYILSMPYSYSNWDDKDNPPLPCWSVGRLIEIYTECIEESKGSYIIINKNFVIDDILYRITEDFDYLDFSKLEE